ncbi:MAG: hypothetical protein JWL77_463 [Chthonomonadaceae bacterium]|nr:hypothetical protein [Chthonomonadaceae bacterium]
MKRMGKFATGWILSMGGGALLAAIALAARGQQTNGAPPKPTITSAQDTEFFETRVRPVLFEKCFGCHGKAAQQGGLRLDSLAAILHGGGSGMAVVVPGEPDKSNLIKAVHYDTNLKMPPSGKLKPEEIAALTEWVKRGAHWPGAVTPVAVSANGEYVPSQEQASHWSFKPFKRSPLPTVKNTTWCKTPIDRFILAKLEAKGLKPAPYADRRTLIRRANFDLIGLPPTPAEVDAFVADTAPDAFAKVVDRLLADPRYGERWGRHWLDVARYADNKGYVFTEDKEYHYAYTYRDYVIRSFNNDLPYDRFVKEQLAADRMQSGDDRSSLAAMGFLTLGRRFLNDQAAIIDDRIDVTSRGLMGLTVACARCHNHKFDPIPNKDYYSLYGVFASSYEPNPPVVISPKSVAEPYEKQNAQVVAAQKQVNDLNLAQIVLLRKKAAQTPPAVTDEIAKTLQGFRTGTLPDGKQYAKILPNFEPAAQATIKDLNAKMADLKKTMPPTPEMGMAMLDSDKPYDPYVFIRGNPGNHGDNVPRRFLQILSGQDRKPFTQGSGRLELAEDIASPTNPLTARVFVNRVWLNHFGFGIVRTPSDFGMRGDLPTHPELLDWLASEFVAPEGLGDHYACGWSMKRLHRMMLLSATWQQSSEGDAHKALVDPENRLLTHQNRQRLDLESMRDSLLAVAGDMDTKIGGPAVELTTAPYTKRRTVYGYIDRANLQNFYRSFDFASPDASSAQRYHTTVPQQALYMMNSPFVVEEAKALLRRPEMTAAKDDAQRIRILYRLLYQRLPSPDETSAGLNFLKAIAEIRPSQTALISTSSAPAGAGLSPWEEYTQTLLMTNEFNFVD